MNIQSFSLQPFPTVSPLPDIKIKCTVVRNSNTLDVSYELSGDIKDLLIPEKAGAPARKTRLWEETCLELFLGISNSPVYREFNLSPAGHWNVFLFDAYRQGMREEPAFKSLPFNVQVSPDSFVLCLEIELNRIIRTGQSLEAAVCAVVKQKNGNTSYWAVTHKGLQADFHRRDSFIIEL